MSDLTLSKLLIRCPRLVYQPDAIIGYGENNELFIKEGKRVLETDSKN